MVLQSTGRDHGERSDRTTTVVGGESRRPTQPGLTVAERGVIVGAREEAVMESLGERRWPREEPDVEAYCYNCGALGEWQHCKLICRNPKCSVRIILACVD